MEICLQHSGSCIDYGNLDFHLVMRIYLPDMNAISNGWNSPAITKTANREP